MFSRLLKAYDAFVDVLFEEEQKVVKPPRKPRDYTQLTEEEKVEARLMYSKWRKDNKVKNLEVFVPIFNKHFGTDKSTSAVYRILTNGGS